MKLLASWMLMAAVLLGLQFRVLASDPCVVPASMSHQDHSGHLHHQDHSPCDSGHDEKCPSEHHHHCDACGHVAPVVSENDSACLLPVPASHRLRMRPECDSIPEGPYLSSEKPPII